jgi:hypothetical protein
MPPRPVKSSVAAGRHSLTTMRRHRNHRIDTTRRDHREQHDHAGFRASSCLTHARLAITRPLSVPEHACALAIPRGDAWQSRSFRHPPAIVEPAREIRARRAIGPANGSSAARAWVTRPGSANNIDAWP